MEENELLKKEKGEIAYELIKHYLSQIMFQEKGVIHGFSEDDLKKIGLTFNSSLKERYKKFFREVMAETYRDGGFFFQKEKEVVKK